MLAFGFYSFAALIVFGPNRHVDEMVSKWPRSLGMGDILDFGRPKEMESPGLARVLDGTGLHQCSGLG